MLDYLTPDDMEALDKENRNLKEIDYTQNASKSVSLPIDCRRIKLALRFFQESQMNSIKVRFTYSFTQKSDKSEEKAIMKQNF